MTLATGIHAVTGDLVTFHGVNNLFWAGKFDYQFVRGYANIRKAYDLQLEPIERKQKMKILRSFEKFYEASYFLVTTIYLDIDRYLLKFNELMTIMITIFSQ